MSLVGGGTDLPAFYLKQGGGAVVSTAINKYVYVAVHKEFGDRMRIAYSKVEHPKSVSKIQHPLIREALRLSGLKGGIEIMSMADIPSTGTGLGSSSSFTVGLLNALWTYQGATAHPYELAHEACHIEIDRCGSPIGKQDQYAAAYGGFNYITFNTDGTICVTPIKCKLETLLTLERRTLLFYTGKTRKSWTVLKEQNGRMIRKVRHQESALTQMFLMAGDLKTMLEANNLSDYGTILDANWQYKKTLTPHVTSKAIDKWYYDGLKAGAEGGKLLGAGNGGFLMFYAKEEYHEAIAAALPLRKIDFKFEECGSQVVYRS
jgi:D-glycero-alpha-D-manno-heptose-7-phosphate kinase